MFSGSIPPTVYFQLRRHGFATIDALDGCDDMLKKAAEKNVYRNFLCERLGPNRLNIDDST